MLLSLSQHTAMPLLSGEFVCFERKKYRRFSLEGEDEEARKSEFGIFCCFGQAPRSEIFRVPAFKRSSLHLSFKKDG